MSSRNGCGSSGSEGATTIPTSMIRYRRLLVTRFIVNTFLVAEAKIGLTGRNNPALYVSAKPLTLEGEQPRIANT